MPFAVHASVRPEFEQRWSRARVPLWCGFLGPPAVSLAVAGWVTWAGAVVPGLVVAVASAAVPVWFVASRAHLRHTAWWRRVVAWSAAGQAVGLAVLTREPWPPLAAVAAGVLGVFAVGAAQAVLLDAANGAIAATTLGVHSDSRRVRGPTGRFLLAHARFDDDLLRWRISPGVTAPDVLGGELRLCEVTGVWVAEAAGAPGGPVVVVRTAARHAQLVVGDPHAFATLLDRRLRLLAHPDWWC